MGNLDHIPPFIPLRGQHTLGVGIVAAALEEAMANLIYPDELEAIAGHIMGALEIELFSMKTTDPTDTR